MRRLYIPLSTTVLCRQEFWTIEPESRQAKFGSTNHVIAPIEDASKHFGAVISM